MNLVIDVREACRPKRAGKGQWVYGLIHELCTRDCSILLLTDSVLPEAWLKAENVSYQRFAPGWRWHLKAASYLKAQKDSFDYFISPTSFIVPSLVANSIPTVAVVHDLIAFRPEPHNAKARWIERMLLQRTVQSAAQILTVSQSTKLDIHKRYPRLSPSKVCTVYAGPFTNMQTENRSDDYTILCIATLCPRKNQKRLIEAYAALPQVLRLRYRLVLVGGRGWHDSDIVTLAEKTTGVEYRGYCSSQECEALLHSCTLFAYPSLYEGFGMPVLDALSCGIPVLTSNRGSLSEVVGDNALCIDPEDTKAISQGLQELLTNTKLRQNLADKGPKQAAQFSWSRTVDLMLQSLPCPSSTPASA